MSAKFIAGVIVGAGAALAILYITSDDESEIRKNIEDFLSSSLEKGKELVKEYTQDTDQKTSPGKEG